MPAIPVQLPDLAQNQSGALGILRRLENGAQLQGRVQRATVTGQTPVQVGKAILPLVLPDPIAAGTLVTLRSQGGKILLESQPPSNPTTSSAPQQNPTAGLAQTLPEATVALIRALHANQLPAQIETLQAIQTVLGQVAPDQLPILAFLLTRNVAITPELLSVIRDRLRARGNLGEELGKLSTGVEQLLSSNVQVPEELRELLAQLRSILFWNPKGSLDERIQILRDFLNGFEAKVLGGQGIESDLKSLLLKLESLLPSIQSPIAGLLQESVQKVLNLLEGAQLASLPSTTPQSSEDWNFWRIPFPGDPNPSTVEFAVRGERDPDNPDQLDPASMEIILQLDLEALGPLRVRVATGVESLMLRFSVDRKESREVIVGEMDNLITTLQGQGFRGVTTEVRIEAVNPSGLIDELGALRQIEKNLNDPSQSSRLDIKM